jgi:hypothetical protein
MELVFCKIIGSTGGIGGKAVENGVVDGSEELVMELPNMILINAATHDV